jgi:hypothetical protein
VRNDGNIMDFYSMTATSDLGWTVTPDANFTYADPGETVYVFFDLVVPAWPGGTPDVVDFEIMSHLDPSLKVGGSVQVTASLDVTYDVTIVDPPTNDLGTPGSTIRFHVGVRNDGNVEDEFSIGGVSDLGWTVTPQAGTMHANPGETVYLYFDVDIPSSKAEDETSVITYTVTSEGEPSEQAQGTVDLVCDSGTDVLDDLGGVLPDHLVLTQNYPNPFNPATAFEFALPQSSPVRIDIINVLGQTVDVIDMGQVASGVHKVDYDASSLSSGVYFYRLQSNSGVETRKMMLLK